MVAKESFQRSQHSKHSLSECNDLHIAVLKSPLSQGSGGGRGRREELYLLVHEIFNPLHNYCSIERVIVDCFID